MKISTRGRYAVRILIDLARNASDTNIPLKDMAKRQGISEKYLGQILPLLSKSGLILAVAGKGGGYRLSREPSAISVGEVLSLTEGELAPVTCLECGKACENQDSCPALPMWREFFRMTNEYFDGITIAELANSDKSSERT